MTTILQALNKVLGDAHAPIALHEPHFAGQEWAYVKDCLDTGWVSSVGAYVDQFEEKLAEKCGVKYAIPVVNGTAALHIMLRLAGVEDGDEVLMPALTFIATANAVSYCNAVPHFVECEDQALSIDPEKLKNYLSSIANVKEGKLYNKQTGRRIAALMPVHVFGHPADMDVLQEIAEEYNLPLVADAAESLGSLYKGKPVESYGLCATTSFNGNKIMTTGGGGAILTNDPDLARRAKHLTTTAKVPHKWEFVHDEVGYNYRMPNINAAIGCAQLEQLDGFLSAKQKIVAAYIDAFVEVTEATFLTQPDYAQSNYWLSAIKLTNPNARDEILQTLNDAGYMCRPIWRLMHKMEMYKDSPRMDLGVSEALEACIINIPSSVKHGL